MSSNLIIDKSYEVLIVEDEAILALSLEEKLKDMGLDVSGIATTPQKAKSFIRDNTPDLAIIDINLNASENGIDVANYFWKNYNVPIIFLTSYCSDKLLKQAMESEPYAYLLKPCKDRELKAIINTTLHKHQFFFKNKKVLLEKEKKFLTLKENIKYDLINHDLYKDEKLVKLTKNEKKIFELLSKTPNKIISFSMIYTYIWREEFYDLSRLRSLIYRIKNKLGTNVLVSFYDQGYKLKVIKNG